MAAEDIFPIVIAVAIVGNVAAYVGPGMRTDNSYGQEVGAASDIARERVRTIVLTGMEQQYLQHDCADTVASYTDVSPWFEEFQRATFARDDGAAVLALVRGICGDQSQAPRTLNDDPQTHRVDVPFSYEKHGYTGIWPFGRNTVEEIDTRVAFDFTTEINANTAFYTTTPNPDGEGYINALTRLRAEHAADVYDSSWLGTWDRSLLLAASYDKPTDRPTLGYDVRLSGMPAGLFGDDAISINFVRDTMLQGYGTGARQVPYYDVDTGRSYSGAWRAFMPPRPDGYGSETRLEAGAIVLNLEEPS